MNLPTPDTNSYINALPFPHCVVDGVFTDSELKFVLAGWPQKHEGYDEKSKKAFTNTEYGMGNVATFIKDVFWSQQFITFLEELTGVNGLVMDWRGGPGLHETYTGGSLQPHLDYLIHNVTGLQHRVNAILYLNEIDGGGDLELFQEDKAYGGKLLHKVVSIPPKFNRLVIFNINKYSWHGHTQPVLGARSRLSIALNYFSVPEPDAKHQRTIFANERTGIKIKIKQLWKTFFAR